jgi:hypothetical protein
MVNRYNHAHNQTGETLMRKALAVLVVLALATSASWSAGSKKPKSGSGGGLPTTVNTSTITASEGSTAMAIRGIMEPEGTTCCAILSVQPDKGFAIARVRLSGRTFKLALPAATLSQVQVGNAVRANFATKIAQINGLQAQVTITGGEPCCEIKAINWGDGAVTVSEPAVGRTFRLNVGADAARNLKVGQKLDANFKAGTAAIGTSQFAITNLSQPGTPLQ